MQKDNWIDVSVPLRNGMVHWPDNPDIKIEKVQDMSCGDACTVSVLSFGSHTGTHMDAPLHFLPKGKGMDQMPFSATIGPARVIEIKDPKSIKAQELKKHKIQRGERILFKTKNSARWNSPEFIEDFVYIANDAAAYLAKCRIKSVGIDYLSVGGFKDNGELTHRTLLGAGIWIIEGLDLSKVKAGSYEFICLPLKVLASDGAPARAVVRPVKGPKTKGGRNA